MGIYRVWEDCAILAFIIQPWFIILSLFYTSQGSSLPDHDPFSGWPHVCGMMGSRQNPVQKKVLSSPEWMNEQSVGTWRFVTENTWGYQWLSVSQGTEQKLHCQRCSVCTYHPCWDCFHLAICLPPIMTRSCSFIRLCFFSENQIHTNTEIKPEFAFLLFPWSLSLHFVPSQKIKITSVGARHFQHKK